MDYLVLKWLHIVSSTLLFGTGIGSAWYMLFANVSRDVRAIAVVSKYVVIADWLFTATTAVLQPLTGFYMIYLAGYPLHSKWIMWSIMLYVLAGVRDGGKLDRRIGGIPGVGVLHKAGWVDSARHDNGLVFWRGGVFVAAVMTYRSYGVGTASDVLAGRVAATALRRFRG